MTTKHAKTDHERTNAWKHRKLWVHKSLEDEHHSKSYTENRTVLTDKTQNPFKNWPDKSTIWKRLWPGAKGCLFISLNLYVKFTIKRTNPPKPDSTSYVHTGNTLKNWKPRLDGPLASLKPLAHLAAQKNSQDLKPIIA